MAELQSRMLIVADRSLPFERLQDCRELAQSFSNFLGEPIDLVFAQPEVMVAARIGAEPGPGDDPAEVLRPGAPAAGMPAGDFVYLPDGTPNWGVMWESFCDLALYGGPAHRGEDSRLLAPGTWGEPADGEFDAIEEVRRGIWETTGMYAELSDQPGWLVIECRSEAMAAWLAATIILENVAARFDGNRLFVPASRSFTLKDEVKSVITVVAKTHHYWMAHVLTLQATSR